MKRVSPASAGRKTSWLSVALVLLCLALGIAAIRWPSGYALYQPGPARPIEPLVTIPADQRVGEPSQGGFYLTSVYIDEEVGLAEAAVAQLTGQATLVPIDEVHPPGVPSDEMNRISQLMLRESELAAQVVALRAAGFSVPLQGDGVEVAAVLPNSAAEGELEPGDIIVGIDGHPIETVAQLVPRIRGRPPGTTITLGVHRAEQEGTEAISLTTQPATDAPGESMIGISALTHNLRFDLPFPIEFNVTNLGGGSAGLMFALTIYDAITPGDLTHGLKIAGTGTITPEGEVGPVGGVREKVQAAEELGAAYFLVPVEDAAEAQAAARTVEVIQVATFDEARAALEAIDSGSNTAEPMAS